MENVNEPLIEKKWYLQVKITIRGVSRCIDQRRPRKSQVSTAAAEDLQLFLAIIGGGSVDQFTPLIAYKLNYMINSDKMNTEVNLVNDPIFLLF
jgi:hypothetical protein